MTPAYAIGLAVLAIVALIVLIARFKLNPFIVLFTVSLALALAAGMNPTEVVRSFETGMGNALGHIAIVIALGTMLGKMLAESGGAERIALTMIDRFGASRVHWAMMLIGFTVGLPVFFEVGFVLLIPIAFNVARRTGTSLLAVGLPLVAGLSVVHGLMPPHPAALLALTAYKADIGRTILYAIIVGLPTAALAGPVFAQLIAPRITLPADNSGVSKAIVAVAMDAHISLLLLAWLLAAIVRLAAGSSTVAMSTSAAIVAPIAAASPGTSAEMLVLVTGAGSLLFSHVNDGGFWLVKEYFNMTVTQTLKTWSVLESIISVGALLLTLALSLVV